MDIFIAFLIFAIVAGGMYFAYWGIQRILKEDEGRNRRTRRRSRKR